MSLEEREGILDRLLDNGILLSGDRFSYSKWFEGDRPAQEAVGRKVRVLLDVGEKCSFLKRVLAIGDKAIGWKPPGNPKGGPWQGGGRRLSPEELALKREEGVRIARSVAIDRATVLVKEGISPEKVAALAKSIEGYILTGNFAKEEKGPQDASLPAASAAPATEVPAPESKDKASLQAPSEKGSASPAKAARTRRPDPKAINALFNEAKVAGIVTDWNAYLALCRGVVKSQVKSPYGLTVQEFAKVESDLRGRLARGKVA